MRPTHAERVASAFRSAMTNGAFEHDYLRLPEAVRNAIELIVMTTTEAHPYFKAERVCSLFTMTAQIYRQALDQDQRPQHSRNT